MKNKVIMLILAALGVAAIWAVAHQYICLDCINFDQFKPEHIKAWIQSFGPLAIVVFVLLYAVNTATLLPPIAIMSLSAGVLFGPLWGTVAIMVGAFLGTTLTFFIARIFGEKLVGKFLKGEKAQKFQEQLGQKGFFVILPMRLIGFPPWEVVNYISGLSKIKYRDYILATMIGIFPASFAQAFLTDRVSSFNWKDPSLYIAVGVFILVGAATAFFAKKMGAKEEIKNGEV